MLEKILQYLHNWFVLPGGTHRGDFAVRGGSINAPFLVDGQYFRIIGSIFNDGLHRYPEANLMDEEFSGEVWALAVPPAVIDLADEIKAWREKYPETPYNSESFGGYSYTKASTASPDVASASWQKAFGAELNAWRKLP